MVTKEKDNNAYLVLKLNPTTGQFGLVNIVEFGSDRDRAQSEALKKVAGWQNTYPEASITMKPGYADTCKSVNNHDGFVL